MVTMVTTVYFVKEIGACPPLCQCIQTYYTYCQKIGLTTENLLTLVRAVPYEAVLLDLNSNSIDRLYTGVLDSVPNLQYLNLAMNQIESIGHSVFYLSQQMKELNLRKNRLKEISIGVYVNMSNLRKLHLGANEITQIQEYSFNLPNLQQLFLQKNSLFSLGLYQLSGLASLQILDLSENMIHVLEVGSFKDLPSLQKLYLSQNRISSLAEDVFKGLTSLKELYLDNNLLPSLDCFDVPNFASTLQVLVLTNNSLLAVPSSVFPKLSNLKSLSLDYNRISMVGLNAFVDLQLDRLTLAHNILDAIDRDMFSGVRRISALDLSHNKIQTIKTGALDSFRESVYVLNLSGNNLADIHYGMFRGMVNLQSLNLSQNSVWSILDGSFRELTQMNELILDNNNLQWLSADLLQGPSLSLLSVLGNPLSELRGFTFENSQNPITVLVNLTVESVTEKSATVVWPYRQGSQLYWTLQVSCLSENSAVCDNGVQESSLRRDKTTEVIIGLQPGLQYLVCVIPAFQRSDILVSQCGVLTTLQHPPVTSLTTNADVRESSGQAKCQRETTVFCVCLLATLCSVWFHHLMRRVM